MLFRTYLQQLPTDPGWWLLLLVPYPGTQSCCWEYSHNHQHQHIPSCSKEGNPLHQSWRKTPGRFTDSNLHKAPNNRDFPSTLQQHLSRQTLPSSEYSKHLITMELIVFWEERIEEAMRGKVLSIRSWWRSAIKSLSKAAEKSMRWLRLKRADPWHATGKHAGTCRLCRLGEGVWCCEAQNTQWTQETSLMTRPSTSMRCLILLDQGGSEQ